MNRALFLDWAGIALLVVLGVSVARAAEEKAPSGSISGKVVDKSGLAVADCLVFVAPAAQKMRLVVGEGVTDKEGKFNIQGIPDGEYNVKFRTRDGKGKATKSASVADGRALDLGKITLQFK